MRSATLLLLSTTVMALIITANVSTALAENMESNSYRIQFGNFNVTSGEKSNDNYKVTDTVGQTGDGPYGQYGVSGYFVGGGFQYIYQIKEFNFSISKLSINLGSLVPGIHNTDSHTITVTTRGSGGYRVYAYEAHPLLHEDGTTIIPDTTCDGGSCTEVTAQSWVDQNIPGFGFNMSGADIPIDFINANHFRQFANAAAPETMQVVMSSPNSAINKTATVTYKAGVSGIQAAGNYETYVVFVAVPGY